MKVKVLVAQSCMTLCDPMDCSCQVPLSTEFSRQEYWSGLPFSSLVSIAYGLFMDWEDPLEKRMATHSSILA